MSKQSFAARAFIIEEISADRLPIREYTTEEAVKLYEGNLSSSAGQSPSQTENRPRGLSIGKSDDIMNGLMDPLGR